LPHCRAKTQTSTAATAAAVWGCRRALFEPGTGTAEDHFRRKSLPAASIVSTYRSTVNSACGAIRQANGGNCDPRSPRLACGKATDARFSAVILCRRSEQGRRGFGRGIAGRARLWGSIKARSSKCAPGRCSTPRQRPQLLGVWRACLGLGTGTATDYFNAVRGAGMQAASIVSAYQHGEFARIRDRPQRAMTTRADPHFACRQGISMPRLAVISAPIDGTKGRVVSPRKCARASCCRGISQGRSSNVRAMAGQNGFRNAIPAKRPASRQPKPDQRRARQGEDLTKPRRSSINRSWSSAAVSRHETWTSAFVIEYGGGDLVGGRAVDVSGKLDSVLIGRTSRCKSIARGAEAEGRAPGALKHGRCADVSARARLSLWQSAI